MKKQITAAALLLSMVMLLGSCGENKQTKTDALISSIVNDSAQNVSGDSASASPAGNSAKAATTDEDWQISDLGNGDIDIDLTQMNATMIYSVIYDIMVNPDNYYGKSIMTDGYFDTTPNEELGVRYYFIVIPDATACCAQGLEFMLPESKVYPDDYPAVKENIRVKGVIDSYEEEGQLYTFIRTDELTIV